MNRTKYGSKKITVNGITFDSKLEARRYAFLAGLEAAGVIFELERQVSFVLVPGFRYEGKAIREMKYIADFRYKDSSGRVVVEDAKGFKTPDYKLKAKFFLWQYCRTGTVRFLEITSPTDTRGIE
jgi:hypothetical protein